MVSNLILKTCDAIFEILAPIYLTTPSCQEEWLKIANDFEELWNLPNMIGALDGKQIRSQCPSVAGTKVHSQKGFFSLVLLAVCDARYCLILIDIGQCGSNNDSGVLKNSKLGKQFESGAINLHPQRTVNCCSFNPIP